MTKQTKTTFIGVLIVFIFLLAVIAYFFVYQKFMQENDHSLIVVDDRSVVSEGVSFQGEINRFVSVYENQEFANPQDLYNFLVLEWNRFLVYPARNELEENDKRVLTENIKKIIIKMEQGDSSVSEEAAILNSLVSMN